MSVDLKGLDHLLSKLDDAQTADFFKSATVELAGRVVSKATKRTPVDTGYLRRGWNMSDVQAYNGDYTVNVGNPVEYAPYIEYGHRTADGRGWVEGNFMLTTAVAEVNNNAQKIVENKLNKFVKDLFTDDNNTD